MMQQSEEDAASLAKSAKIVSERLAALLKKLPTLDAASTQAEMKSVDIEYKRFMTSLNTLVKTSSQQHRS